MRRIVIMLCVSLLLLSVYGCAPNNTSTDVPEKVVIGTMVLVEPDAIAIAEDWFSEAMGTEVEILTFDAARDIIKAMASGDVDIGTSGCTAVASSIANDISFQVIGIQTVIGDTDALVVNAEKKVESAEDLKGLTIATVFSGTDHYSLIKYLEMSGVNPKDVDIVDMKASDIPAAYQRKDIDGAYIWEPQTTEIIKMGGEKIITSGNMADLGYATMDLNIVNDDFANKYPELVTAYASCIDRAVKLYSSDKQKAGSDMEKWVGMNAAEAIELADSATWLNAGEQASDSWLAGETVASLLFNCATFLYEQGDLQTEPVYSKYKDAVHSEYMASVK